MTPKRERTDYGARVFKARTSAKLTQPQLAKAAGMSQGTLGELEYNADSSRYTAQIAAACGVRAEWLATGKGPMRDSTSLLPEVADIAAQINAMPDAQREFVLDTIRETMATFEKFLKTRTESVQGQGGAALGSDESSHRVKRSAQ